MFEVNAVRMPMPTRPALVNMLAIMRGVANEIDRKNVTQFEGPPPAWLSTVLSTLTARYPVDDATCEYVSHIIDVVIGPDPPEVRETLTKIINLVQSELERLFWPSKAEKLYQPY